MKASVISNFNKEVPVSELSKPLLTDVSVMRSRLKNLQLASQRMRNENRDNTRTYKKNEEQIISLISKISKHNSNFKADNLGNRTKSIINVLGEMKDMLIDMSEYKEGT